ncbi:hypothetical protein [Azospirillum doebereinerae]
MTDGAATDQQRRKKYKIGSLIFLISYMKIGNSRGVKHQLRYGRIFRTLAGVLPRGETGKRSPRLRR